MSSHSAKKKRPLPIIDLDELLGYSNARLKTSNNDEITANSQENSSKKQEKMEVTETTTMQANPTLLQSDHEPRHPTSAVEALVSMTGPSFHESLLSGPSSVSHQGDMCSGNSGTVEDSSLAVTTPASKPSAMLQRNALPVRPHGSGTIGGNKSHGLMMSTPAKAQELALNDGIQAQQQTRTVTPEQHLAIDTTAGKIVDAKEDKVGDTTAVGKVVDTKEVMTNRNICIPLDPVPAVCST
jgi:hypothetical protein